MILENGADAKNLPVWTRKPENLNVISRILNLQLIVTKFTGRPGCSESLTVGCHQIGNVHTPGLGGKQAVVSELVCIIVEEGRRHGGLDSPHHEEYSESGPDSTVRVVMWLIMTEPKLHLGEVRHCRVHVRKNRVQNRGEHLRCER